MIVLWLLSALVSSIFSSAPVNNSAQVVPSPVVQQQAIVTQSPSSTPTVLFTETPTPTKYIAPTYIYTPVSTEVPESTDLSNDNYYQNSAGNEVHSPAYSDTTPAGASAICGDGTYSFSQSRRGTCSHHGGVVQWL